MAPAHYAHHPLPPNPGPSTSRSATPGTGVARDVLRTLQDVQWSDDEDDPDCLLCAEPLDLSDLNFKPCQCGLQICQFCYNKLLTTDARCPGCRRAYDQQAVEFQPVEFEAIKRVKATKQQRAKINKQLEALGRRHLREVRIVMKNTVYVVGMKLPAPGDEAIPILRSNDYFGQYGKISKLSIKRPADGQPGIYIAYVRREDAQRAILALDGIPAPQNPGQVLKASHGTARYCDSFLRGVKCDNPSNCTNLHEWGGESDTFTKEDLSAAFIKAKDPVPGPPKVISIPAMQKSAWPKPSADETIDSSALPRSSNWGMRPAPVIPAPTSRRKKHVLNLVPLGRPANSYTTTPSAPTPTKEKKPPIIIRANSMVRGRSTSTSSGVASPRVVTPVQEPEPEPVQEPEMEPELEVVEASTVPAPEPESAVEAIEIELDSPPVASSPTPPTSDPSPTPPPFADPAIASSSFSAPVPASIQFPNYPIHSPYPEFDDVFSHQSADTSLAFSWGFDDDELDRQIASCSFEPFATFGGVLNGLPSLGISGAVSALMAVRPIGDDKSYAGVFDPFAPDEMDEGEAARKASRFGFARRPSEPAVSPLHAAPVQAQPPSQAEVKWSATDPRIQQLQMHLQRGVPPSPDARGPPPGLGPRDASPFQDPAIAMMRPPPALDPHSAQAHSTARMLQHLQQMRSPSPSPGSETVPLFPVPSASLSQILINGAPPHSTLSPPPLIPRLNDNEIEDTTFDESKEPEAVPPSDSAPVASPSISTPAPSVPTSAPSARQLSKLHFPLTPAYPDELELQTPVKQELQGGEAEFPALSAPETVPSSARVPKVKKEKRSKVVKDSVKTETAEAASDVFSAPDNSVIVQREDIEPAVEIEPTAALAVKAAAVVPEVQAEHVEKAEVKTETRPPTPTPATASEIKTEPKEVATPAPRAKVLRIPSISANPTPVKVMTPRPSATSTPVPSRPASPSGFPLLGTPSISQASLAALSIPPPGSAASSVSMGTPTGEKDKKKRKKGGTKVKPPEPPVTAPVIGEQPAFAPRKKEKAFKPPVIKPPKAPKAAPAPGPAPTSAREPEPAPEPESESEEPEDEEPQISVVTGVVHEEIIGDPNDVDDEEFDDEYETEPVPILTVAEMLAQINEVVDVQQFSSFFSAHEIDSRTSFGLASLDTAVAALAGISSDQDLLPDQTIKDDQARALRDLLHTMTRVCGEQYKLFPGSPKVLDSHFVLKGARQRVDGETETARKARLAHRGPVTNEMMRLQMEKIEDYKASVNDHAIQYMLSSYSEEERGAHFKLAELEHLNVPIQELERAWQAARQEELAVATELAMVQRENAKVLDEAALMW